MTQPNFIVFMTDHQRGDTILADSKVKTPYMDAFRQKSVAFRNAYCPAPHCCPSRASFYTGLYPSQHGVWNNVSVSNTLSRGLYEGVRTFPEDLKEAGYNLYFSGKWHVSEEESPGDRGFELTFHDTSRYKKFPHEQVTSDWQVFNKKILDTCDTSRGYGEVIRPGYPHFKQFGIRENPFGDGDVAEAAVSQLENLKDTEDPFLLFVGPLGPHDPYCVPQEFLDMYSLEDMEFPENYKDDMEDKPVLYRRTKERYDQLTHEEHLDSLRHFYAFCSYEDYLFGQVIEAMEANNLAENTVVIYCSDHGDYMGSHGLWAKGLPCFREAYNVCAMIGGTPISHPNRECEKPINLVDFAPTILDLAGVQYQENRFIGQSLLPFLQDDVPNEWRQDCFTQTNGNEVYGIQRAVFNDKWKYVFNSFDYDELYNLEEDPGELKNLIYGPAPEKGAYGPIIKEMWRKLWKFAYETGDNYITGYIMTALAPYGPGILKEYGDVEDF